MEAQRPVKDSYQETVYKIEHFYSMGSTASQGKICRILYACSYPQLCDLKRKKPICEDGLFNLSGSLKISSFFR